MWRTTGDAKWRDRGWAIYEAIEKHARTATAYASVLNVNQIPASKDNDMPSFFFAETYASAFALPRSVS